MERIKCLDSLDRIVICGAGYQTETLAKYVNAHLDVECIILVEMFTQKPEDCYRIPSKRNVKRNSFSEVDLLLDSYIEDVPVKRFDMLSQWEKQELTFVYYNSEESICLFHKIESHIRLKYYIDDEELNRINDCVWKNHSIINELWKTNRILFSELQVMKNALRRQLKPTVFDFHFEFHLVEHCNLNCAGCTHFSPIANEKYLSIDEFEKDIFRLSELTEGKARFINLLGGEPLLHPEICSFLRVSRKAFPKTLIRIVTNGILLDKMPDDFWNCCVSEAITIGITQYPISIDYQGIMEKLISHNIQIESFSGDGCPRDEMWRLSLDEANISRPIDNFINCPRANACVFVSHGKVFNCATMANIDHFNKSFGTNMSLCEDDFVDIYKINDVNSMLEKICTPKPFCRFCNIEKRRYGIKWTSSKGDIKEWS